MTGCLGLITEIQKVVINEVNEKLGTGRMRIRRSSHRDASSHVRQTVRRFILDVFMRGLLVHIGSKTTALDHKIRNDAMEDRAVVMTFISVTLEVCTSNWRSLGVELENDDAFAGRDGSFHGMNDSGCLRIEAADCSSPSS